MLNQAEVTSLIGTGSASTDPLARVDFGYVEFSPAVVLDSGFSPAITDDSDFLSACQWGYETYFDDRYEWDENGTDMVFMSESYSFADVIAFVFREIFPEKNPYPLERTTLVCRVGVTLGWLSAHAQVDRPVALLAVEVLRVLLDVQESRLR